VYRQECRTDLTVLSTEIEELMQETTKVCKDISSCNHTDWGGVYIRIIVVSGFRYIATWGSWDARGSFDLQEFKRLLGRKFKLQTTAR
jgi:hypothetical protein